MSDNETIQKSARPVNTGIIFSAFATITLVSAFSYGYFKLNNINAALADTVSVLQDKVTESQKEIVSLQSSLKELQTAPLEQAKSKEELTRLYMALSALNTGLDRLPLPIGPVQVKQEAPETVPENLTWWQTGLAKTWGVLKKIVIVRYNATDMPPLVLPEEKHYLFMNLHAEMQNAMWAVLHGNKEIYQQSLQQVTSWVLQYFVVNAPETQAVLKQLQDLQGVANSSLEI